ncbi:NADP-dependent oxidoreductase [Ktedonobacter robiniae]|uniref:NADPH:quinone reductase n=1 Tax=Ktedonobacter robiniae TaxID=2778365 RepID=A0ABQ3UVV4_9CHLR|nr:NADP-dependent oxidoreductase [Ktedonobacter robiniae]GHO56808.1 NADPH:quinone reductase [Ktedonobacter robiniae]
MNAETMKAIRIYKEGGPEVLVYEDVPRPTAGPGEVLLRIHVASINPADWRGQRGFPDIPEKFRPRVARPSIPGFDASGIVEAVGPGVSEFREGDAVFGMIRFPERASTYAEYTTAPVTQLARKPATIDHLQAAAIPMAGLTAWQELFDQANLQAGQTVLINGAAGGVGHFAVQLAKVRGARVIGVASGRHADFLRDLGVDQFIDYTTTPVEQAARDVDLLIDMVGGANSDRLLATLRRGGTLIPVNFNYYTPERVAEAGALVKGKRVQVNVGQLAEIARLVGEGRVCVAFETILPLAEARKAHEIAEAGHVRGKIVLRVIE